MEAKQTIHAALDADVDAIQKLQAALAGLQQDASPSAFYRKGGRGVGGEGKCGKGWGSGKGGWGKGGLGKGGGKGWEGLQQFVAIKIKTLAEACNPKISELEAKELLQRALNDDAEAVRIIHEVNANPDHQPPTINPNP